MGRVLADLKSIWMESRYVLNIDVGYWVAFSHGSYMKAKCMCGAKSHVMIDLDEYILPSCKLVDFC